MKWYDIGLLLATENSIQGNYDNNSKNTLKKSPDNSRKCQKFQAKIEKSQKVANSSW